MRTMRMKQATVTGAVLVTLLASGFFMDAAIADPVTKKPGAGRVVVNPPSAAKAEGGHNPRADMMAEVQQRASRRASAGRRHGQRR
jgi:hypothetical protein